MIIVWASTTALRALSTVVGDQKLTGAVGGVVLPESFTQGLIGICTTEKSQKGGYHSREIEERDGWPSTTHIGQACQDAQSLQTATLWWTLLVG